MPVQFRAGVILVAVLFAGAGAAYAQSASSSGAQDAETEPPVFSVTAPGGLSSSTAASRRARRGAAASPAMQTGASPAPTGPDTSTVQPDTSDLTGSNGASITQSQGAAPPGRAPPNGSAPDTGGGAGVDNVPNTEGPH